MLYTSILLLLYFHVYYMSKYLRCKSSCKRKFLQKKKMLNGFRMNSENSLYFFRFNSCATFFCRPISASCSFLSALLCSPFILPDWRSFVSFRYYVLFFCSGFLVEKHIEKLCTNIIIYMIALYGYFFTLKHPNSE